MVFTSRTRRHQHVFFLNIVLEEIFSKANVSVKHRKNVQKLFVVEMEFFQKVDNFAYKSTQIHVFLRGGSKEFDLLNNRMYKDNHSNYILNCRSEVALSRSYAKTKIFSK